MSYTPPGIEFYDQATEQTMRYVTRGHSKGWLVRKHRHTTDWVTVREATADDLDNLAKATGVDQALLPELERQSAP